MTRHRARNRPTPAPAPAELVAKTPEEILEDLRNDISQVLRDLDGLAPAIRDLQDTHQPGLGFLTPADKRARSAAHARDMRDHALRLQDNQPVGPGERPSPGNVAAISVDAQIWFVLRHQIRTLSRHVTKTTGEPFGWPAPGEGAALTAVTWHLSLLIDAVTDTKLLRTTLRDLQHAQRTAETLVRGTEADDLLPHACPWCGNQSLVANHSEGVIACQHDLREASPCVCTDNFCDCKRDPVKHEHTWHRAHGTKATSWWGLVDQTTRITREKTQKNQEPHR